MYRLKRIISVLITMAMLAAFVPVHASAADTARYMEALDRGLVAMMTDGGVYLTWRLLGTEAYDTTFDVYRDDVKIATAISDSTDYLDANGSASSVYKVVSSVENAANVTKTASAFASGKNYLEIPVAPIENFVYDGTEYEFKIQDASVGDVDGDGEYEIIVKREANHQHAGTAGHNYMFIEAYKLDGTILWRIDMGQNMRAMTEFVFLVYDFNNDGAAEIACKTAPGSKDATGAYVTSVSTDSKIKSANNSANYYNDSGYILTGPEYFTLFDGRNGKALDTIEYPILRGTNEANDLNSTIWGDGYGHRAEKCMGVVAYLDGVNPSMVLWRGIYTRIAAASITVDNNTNRMSIVNRFDTYSGGNGYKTGYEKYVAQGNHSIAVGDVDGDGKDEVMSGGLCLNDDMSPLWCTYRGHGDAHHLADYDPINAGLEYFNVQEESAIHDKDGNLLTKPGGAITNDFKESITLDHGMTLINAANGKELYHEDHTKDTGRGMMANTGQGGYYQITAANIGTYTVNYNENGEQTYTKQATTCGMNFRIFWDGDLYDELFDGYSSGALDFRPTITDYDKDSGSYKQIFCDNDTVTINYTKCNPLLQADIFGDWREELVVKTNDDMAMRIYTTNIPTDNKLYTLMHDTLYRQGVALQNQYYNQPPHIGYYVCEKSDTLYNAAYDKREVQPNIKTVTYSGGKPAVTPTPIDVIPTERNSSYIIDEDGDYYSGVNTALPNTNWTSKTDGIGRQVYLSTTNASKYLSPALSSSYFKNNCGKFLLFGANGAATSFETSSATTLTGTGKLSFDFLMPSTFSDNGSFAYGNAPTTVYVGDGTSNALEFTVTPKITKGYAEAAILYVNGTNICSYSSKSDVQSWTNVECAIDSANSKAYIAVTKADGNIYTAEVNMNSCGSIDTFGVDASANYGAIALDGIKLYSTGSLEKPSASATGSYTPVDISSPEKEKTHTYELDVTNYTAGKITYTLSDNEVANTSSVTGDEIAQASVGDFGTGTMKTAVIPELDGWGYRHYGYTSGLNSERQTSAYIDPDTNQVFVSGVGTNKCNGAISFIPKNIDGITIANEGIVTYSFTAYSTCNAGNASNSVTYGFTTSEDGSSVNSAVAAYLASPATNGESTTANVVMTYNLATGEYTITADGAEPINGTDKNITGIYMQVPAKYVSGGIANLTVDSGAITFPVPDTLPVTQTITASKVRNEVGKSETTTLGNDRVWLNYYPNTWGAAYFGFSGIEDFDPSLVEKATLTFTPISYSTTANRQFYFDLFGTDNNWTAEYKTDVASNPYPSDATLISHTSCNTNGGKGDVLVPNTPTEFDITEYVKTLAKGTTEMSFITAIPSGACVMLMQSNPVLTITMANAPIDTNVTLDAVTLENDTSIENVFTVDGETASSEKQNVMLKKGSVLATVKFKIKNIQLLDKYTLTLKNGDTVVATVDSVCKTVLGNIGIIQVALPAGTVIDSAEFVLEGSNGTVSTATTVALGS